MNADFSDVRGDGLPLGGVGALERLAYQLHHVDRLPWVVVAEELGEPVAVVKDLAHAYVERTDAAARDVQDPLF